MSKSIFFALVSIIILSSYIYSADVIKASSYLSVTENPKNPNNFLSTMGRGAIFDTLKNKTPVSTTLKDISGNFQEVDVKLTKITQEGFGTDFELLNKIRSVDHSPFMSYTNKKPSFGELTFKASFSATKGTDTKQGDVTFIVKLNDLLITESFVSDDKHNYYGLVSDFTVPSTAVTVNASEKTYESQILNVFSNSNEFQGLKAQVKTQMDAKLKDVFAEYTKWDFNTILTNTQLTVTADIAQAPFFTTAGDDSGVTHLLTGTLKDNAPATFMEGNKDLKPLSTPNNLIFINKQYINDIVAQINKQADKSPVLVTDNEYYRNLFDFKKFTVINVNKIIPGK